MMTRVVDPSSACIKRLVATFSEYHIESVVNKTYYALSIMQLFGCCFWVHLTGLGLACFRNLISHNQSGMKVQQFVQVYRWYSLLVSFHKLRTTLGVVIQKGFHVTFKFHVISQEHLIGYFPATIQEMFQVETMISQEHLTRYFQTVIQEVFPVEKVIFCVLLLIVVISNDLTLFATPHQDNHGQDPVHNNVWILLDFHHHQPPVIPVHHIIPPHLLPLRNVHQILLVNYFPRITFPPFGLCGSFVTGLDIRTLCLLVSSPITDPIASLFCKPFNGLWGGTRRNTQKCITIPKASLFCTPFHGSWGGTRHNTNTNYKKISINPKNKLGYKSNTTTLRSKSNMGVKICINPNTKRSKSIMGVKIRINPNTKLGYKSNTKSNMGASTSTNMNTNLGSKSNTTTLKYRSNNKTGSVSKPNQHIIMIAASSVFESIYPHLEENMINISTTYKGMLQIYYGIDIQMCLQ